MRKPMLSAKYYEKRMGEIAAAREVKRTAGGPYLPAWEHSLSLYLDWLAVRHRAAEREEEREAAAKLAAKVGV